MPQITLDMSLEEFEAVILQLPPKELLKLVDDLQSSAETVGMMLLAESGFQEWNEEGEDIYDAQA